MHINAYFDLCIYIHVPTYTYKRGSSESGPWTSSLFEIKSQNMYAYTSICIYLYVYIYICVYMKIDINICISIYVCIYTLTYNCKYICMYLYIYISISTHIYVCVLSCMYIYKYIHAYKQGQSEWGSWTSRLMSLVNKSDW